MTLDQWPAPDPALRRPEPRLVPTDAFAGVRARWLPLVAAAALIVLVIGGAVIGGVLQVDAPLDELFGILLYLPLVIWALWSARRHGIRLQVLFARPRAGVFWWAALGMTVVLFLFSIGASSVTSALFPGYTDSAEVSTAAPVWLLALSLVVFPPLVEELIFRGMLLERWSVKWRIGVAIVVQAVAFGVLHVDPVGAGVFGVVMALAYLRTGSLWVPIAMHALNNGVVLLAVLAAGDTAGESAQSPGALEAIITGVVLMAVSGPVIGWFIWRNWPGPGDLTPYERAEWGAGALPPRHLGRVRIEAGPHGLAGQSARLWTDPAALRAVADRRGRALTTVAFPAVAYVQSAPGDRSIRVTARSGETLTLALPQRSARSRARIVAALADRVTAGGGGPTASATMTG